MGGRLGLLALLALAALSTPAAGQRVDELGVQGMFTGAEPEAVLAVGYAGWRVDDRVRVAVLAGPGVSDGDLAARGELLGHLLINPGAASTRPRFYAGAGIAGVVGPRDAGYAVLLAGVEQRRRGRDGWVAEVGVGGGIRITAGWRWRLPARGGGR